MLFKRKIKLIFLPIYFSFLSISNFTKAEINLNSINDTKTIINKPDNSSCKIGYCNIYGGIKSGKNLFHKFNSFDTRGRIKEVKFFNESQKNVIVGVSSKNGTFINKPIKLQGLANLFWVSPYGLKIEKGGVFVNAKNLNFSTANSLSFSDNIFDVFKNNKYHLKDFSSEPVFNNKPHSKKNNLNLANVEISDTNIVVDEKLYIHSPNGSVHIDNSKLKTSAKNNGEITITGESVFLTGNSHLISMGKDFGGLIQIGGSWQNSNKQISQSNKTIIEDKVVINASSNNGKGGIIVIWSDINNKKGLTRVKGTLISNGNKGGSIETSGANLDVKDIEISLKSKKGGDGLWLLDPFDFVINKTTKVSIENALKKGTNVIITTSNEIDFELSPVEKEVTFLKNYSDDRKGDKGNIKIDNKIDFSSGQGTLKLIADNKIQVNEDIISGPGGLLMRAPKGINGKGSIYINPKKKKYKFNENNPNKVANFLSIDQNVDSQFKGEIIGNGSSSIYKFGNGELSLSYKLKDFSDPIYGFKAGEIISLQDIFESSVTEFVPPKIVIKTASVSPVSSPVAGGGAAGGSSSIAMSSESSSRDSGSTSSSNSTASTSSDTSSSSSSTESSSSAGSSSEGDSGSSSESSSSDSGSSSESSSSDSESSDSSSSSDESSSSESSSDESSSDESSSDESSSDESSSDESSSDEESDASEKGSSNQSKNVASREKKKIQKIKLSAAQSLAGISNIIEIKRKTIIENLNKFESVSANRAINQLNLGNSFTNKTKSTIDLQQAIIKAKEQIRLRDIISEFSVRKNLIAGYKANNLNLNNSEFVFEKEKYNPAIMHITYTPAKGKTIDKNADAFIDLTVIFANGNVSGKRVEITTKNFAKNLGALYSQLSRQEDLKVENESSPSRVLHEILIKSVEDELNKEKITTLLISADRGLQAVPFAALHNGFEYFGEKYAFSITPSLSLTNLDIANNINKKILAIGASQFKELAPLPLVKQELNNISNPINKDIVLNNKFTPETFFEKAIEEKYDKIHLATHAEFKPGGPKASQLFSGTEPISLDKFSILRKGRINNPFELIVLSACRTAVGDQETELGFSGLALQAGSKSAIGTLWYVDDVMTSAYFVQMYSFLDMGIPKAEAMQMTRKAFAQEKIRLENDSLIGINNKVLLSELNNSQKRIVMNGLSNPFFWAGIELMGSPW